MTRLQEERREIRVAHGVARDAKHFAAARFDHLGGIVHERRAKGDVDRNEVPALAAA